MITHPKYHRMHQLTETRLKAILGGGSAETAYLPQNSPRRDLQQERIDLQRGSRAEEKGKPEL